jgi:hypothetical protein
MSDIQLTPSDIRSFGGTRRMDLIMYVLYSNDHRFVQNMVTQVVLEVSTQHECADLASLLKNENNMLMHKCLFFFMFNFHAKFRYWVLTQSHLVGLQPICPHKVVRFLKLLRHHIIPAFLVDESIPLMDLERDLKIEYVRS